MTVGELKVLLQGLDDDCEIVQRADILKERTTFVPVDKCSTLLLAKQSGISRVSRRFYDYRGDRDQKVVLLD